MRSRGWSTRIERSSTLAPASGTNAAPSPRPTSTHSGDAGRLVEEDQLDARPAARRRGRARRARSRRRSRRSRVASGDRPRGSTYRGGSRHQTPAPRNASGEVGSRPHRLRPATGSALVNGSDSRAQLRRGAHRGDRARTEVTERFATRLAARVLEDVRLLVTELVTNALRHGSLRKGDRVSLKASVDRRHRPHRGPRPRARRRCRPSARPASAAAVATGSTSSRSSRSAGASTAADGTVVWCELPSGADR